MEKTSLSRHHIKWIVALLVFFTAGFFLPNFVFLASRIGLFNLVPPVNNVLGAELELPEEWFPLASNDSLLSKVLGVQSTTPKIFYYKNDWMAPWRSSIVIVSKAPPVEHPCASYAKEFSWGVATSCDPDVDTKKIQTYFLPAYSLLITSSEKDVLEKVRGIRKQ